MAVAIQRQSYLVNVSTVGEPTTIACEDFKKDDGDLWLMGINNNGVIESVCFSAGYWKWFSVSPSGGEGQMKEDGE